MTICMNMSRFINLAAIFSLDLESQYRGLALLNLVVLVPVTEAEIAGASNLHFFSRFTLMSTLQSMAPQRVQVRSQLPATSIKRVTSSPYSRTQHTAARQPLPSLGKHRKHLYGCLAASGGDDGGPAAGGAVVGAVVVLHRAASSEQLN